MLIVGGALAVTAIGVFFLWRLVVKCRALWRERKLRQRAAHQEVAERVAAE
ncbi:hypothetical protein [Methyloceanibacter sp.]|uniref:hypothetical protein n=1 Tax=Methyloceanibacter sp. TaxID=1965321 RepID=UPI002D700A5D|nr:hypothetical protein [Methyloceanibacter sp.]HZP08779.1 hypothetical protein [Methyloceanibacter sp.]